MDFQNETKIGARLVIILHNLVFISALVHVITLRLLQRGVPSGCTELWCGPQPHMYRSVAFRFFEKDRGCQITFLLKLILAEEITGCKNVATVGDHRDIYIMCHIFIRHYNKLKLKDPLSHHSLIL